MSAIWIEKVPKKTVDNSPLKHTKPFKFINEDDLQRAVQRVRNDVELITLISSQETEKVASEIHMVRHFATSKNNQHPIITKETRSQPSSAIKIEKQCDEVLECLPLVLEPKKKTHLCLPIQTRKRHLKDSINRHSQLPERNVLYCGLSEEDLQWLGRSINHCEDVGIQAPKLALEKVPQKPIRNVIEEPTEIRKPIPVLHLKAKEMIERIQNEELRVEEELANMSLSRDLSTLSSSSSTRSFTENQFLPQRPVVGIRRAFPAKEIESANSISSIVDSILSGLCNQEFFERLLKSELELH